MGPLVPVILSVAGNKPDRKKVGGGGRRLWLVQRAVFISFLHPRLSRAGVALLYLEIVTVICAVLRPENMLLQYPSPLKVYSNATLSMKASWMAHLKWQTPIPPAPCSLPLPFCISPHDCDHHNTVYQTYSFVTVSSIRISAPGKQGVTCFIWYLLTVGLAE